MQIRAVSENVRKTADIANQLRSSKELFLRQVAEIEQLISTSVQKIKVCEVHGSVYGITLDEVHYKFCSVFLVGS